MRKNLFLLLLVYFCLCSGCTISEPLSKIESSSIPIKATPIYEEATDSLMSYIGIANSASLRKYSFKTSGKIKSVNVQKGQFVESGTTLVEFDKSDLQYQVDTALNQSDAAYAQYQKALSGAQTEDLKTAELNVEKAGTSHAYMKKIYDDTKKLYEEDVISKSNFEEVELSYNISVKDLEQAQELFKKANTGTRSEDISSAKSQYEMAKSNYDAVSKYYDEAVIISDVTGYVTDILCEEGELIQQGYPVILVQSQNKIITCGIIQEDMDKIKMGMKAKIDMNNSLYDGEISSISQMPSDNSRTFDIEISIINSDEKFYIGSIARISIVTGQTKSILLDISQILNDGINYVYIVEDDKAVRKNISINKILNNKVAISGLSSGDMLITTSSNQIKNGYKVEIVNK